MNNNDGLAIVNVVTFTQSREGIPTDDDYHLPGRSGDEMLVALREAGFKIVDEIDAFYGVAVGLMTVTRDSRRAHIVDMGIVTGGSPYYYLPEKSPAEMIAAMENAGFERVNVISELFDRQ